MTQKDTLFIGIDVGGTRCTATAYSSDTCLIAQAQAPSVNLGVSVQRVLAALDDVLAQLSQTLERSLADVSIGIGCAGFSHLVGRERLLQWAQTYPNCHVTSDIHIASLAANAGAACGVVIAGTGTCGAIYQYGQLTQVGGHGLLLGDHGSGAWLGLQAVKHLLAVDDGCSVPTLLSHAVKTFSAERNKDGGKAPLTSVQYFSSYNSNEFAQLAPYVFNAARQGDTQALQMLESGLGHITELVNRVSASHTLPVFYLGGVMQPYLAIAQASFSQHPLLQTDLKPCIHPPEFGAMLFARQVSDNLQLIKGTT